MDRARAEELAREWWTGSDEPTDEGLTTVESLGALLMRVAAEQREADAVVLDEMARKSKRSVPALALREGAAAIRAGGEG